MARVKLKGRWVGWRERRASGVGVVNLKSRGGLVDKCGWSVLSCKCACLRIKAGIMCSTFTPNLLHLTSILQIDCSNGFITDDSTAVFHNSEGRVL